VNLQLQRQNKWQNKIKAKSPAETETAITPQKT
jgi:hypothetical protein